jgi:dTDP-4-dehydrorhamnose reductase
LRVVEDEVGSPTYTRDLAQAVLALCLSGRQGIYHAVNAGACSRYEFARAIAQGAGLTTPIEPCAAADYPAKAPRPAYSVLSNMALEAACGFHMPPWQDALERYLKRRDTAS